MTIIKETSVNHLLQPKHQNYHEPIIIDQDKLLVQWMNLASQGNENWTEITVMAKNKKKMMKELLPDQWFHAKMTNSQACFFLKINAAIFCNINLKFHQFNLKI